MPPSLKPYIYGHFSKQYFASTIIFRDDTLSAARPEKHYKSQHSVNVALSIDIPHFCHNPLRSH